MNNERWQQIEAIFSTALERDGPQRDAYLDQACGDDEQLRENVCTLLDRDQHAEENHFLAASSPLPAPSDMEMPDGDDSLLGRQIGHYEIKRRIGRGGMGNVYLGVRSDDFQQQVAIKLIRRGMDSERIVQRFRNEMQFLAALGNHPHIASIFDAGTTDDGQLYIVLEYIGGQRIDRYCDEQRLGIRARLELFCQACEAIQFAHQNAVLHRDLKPSNLLVTTEGVPKLIDFGIAKLTSDEPGYQQADLTRTMQRALTPDYASPEQFRGQSVTTASDVYSLGVILYELLTGHRPYRTSGRTPAEVEQAVCDLEPVRPSTAVSLTDTVETGDGESIELTPTSISVARRSDPRRLQRAMRGDLDRIAMMALHKDVQRRYQTVDQLTADIERYLDGRPVRARKDTVGYRLRKYVSRNKALVASLASFIAVLIVGIAVTTWLAIAASHAAENERDQRLLAEQNEQIAKQNEQTANRVVELFETMFAAADPSQTNDPDYKVRQLLDDFTDQLGDQLADEPLVEARLMHSMGNAYYGLGLRDIASTKYSRALELRQRVLGETHPETLRAMVDLGRAYTQSDRFVDQGEVVLSRALGLYRHRYGSRHPDTVLTMIHLGQTYSIQMRMDDAEQLLGEAYDVADAEIGDPQITALAAWRRGFNCWMAGDNARAERFLNEAIEFYRREYGEDNQSTMEAIFNLGRVYNAQGRFDETVPIFERYLAYLRNTLSEEHVYTQVLLRHLGDMHFDHGRYDLAEPRYREWYSISEPGGLFGHQYERVLRWCICLRHLGNAEEAEPLLDDCYAYFFEREDPQGDHVKAIREEAQTLYRNTGRPELSEAWEPVAAQTPAGLGPADAAQLTFSAPTLTSTAFHHSIPAMQHRASHWQIRAERDSFAASPTLDGRSQTHLSTFSIPAGLLLPRTTYHWRIAHVGSNLMASDFSPEQTFVTGDLDVQPVPIDLSGYFNQDVIANPGDGEGDYFDTAKCQFLVDGFDGTSQDNEQVQGLPVDRMIGPHRLGDFDDPNVIQLTSQDRKPIQIPLPPGDYFALRFLVSGGNGDSSLPVTLRFGDGSEQLRNVPCLDWYDDRMHESKGVLCTPVRNGMDRMSNGTFEDANDPALFDAILEITPDQELVGLTLHPADATYSGEDTRFNLFAVTGMVMQGNGDSQSF